jgi:hypothetical protein
MAEPARPLSPAPAYDPVRDLATVLHGALRQGFHQPAARQAIERLKRELGITEYDLASDIERAVRGRREASRG